MRPGGREVEKKVGSALSVTPKNGKFYRKSGLGRNLGKERSSKTRTCDVIAVVEVHVFQLRAISQRLDVACVE